LERFIATTGSQLPQAYIQLCELYTGQGSVEYEKIITLAKKGLINTAKRVKERDELASLLAETAKKADDQSAYIYAVTERFYSKPILDNFLPVLELGDHELKETAVGYLDREIAHADHRYGTLIDTIYYVIHFLNQDYDLVFDTISQKDNTLDAFVSVSLFMGLLTGFDEGIMVIRSNIIRAIPCNNPDLLCRMLRENIGSYTEQQQKKWYETCISKVCNSATEIISNQNRYSYDRAAAMIVAVAELRKHLKEDSPYNIIIQYKEKYFRHVSFRKELRLMVAHAGFTELKV